MKYKYTYIHIYIYELTWWVVSGLRVIKSHIASGSFKWVAGFLFCVWIKEGKRIGSLMKKIGVLLPTRSQLPRIELTILIEPLLVRISVMHRLII
jgi:hypothetical protein